MVGDVAAFGAAGRAFAWYTIADYGAIGVGSFLGGVVSQAAGHRAAFVVTAALIMLTWLLGIRVIERSSVRVMPTVATPAPLPASPLTRLLHADAVGERPDALDLGLHAIALLQD